MYLRKFLVAHQSQKYWLLCDCPSVCMSLHPLHINQCEMSICKTLVPKAFPSPRSFGFTAFNWHLSKQSISWPESHDHIASSSHEFIKVIFFFSWQLPRYWIVGLLLIGITIKLVCLNGGLHYPLNKSLYQWTVKSVFLTCTQWIVIYPMDSIIQPLNNWSQ